MSEFAERLDGAHARLKTAARRDLAPEFLTVEEVAEMAHCEHKSVRKAIASGELVAGRPGRRWVIPVEEARRWIMRPRAPRQRRKRARSDNPRGRSQHRGSGGDTVTALRDMDPDL